MLVFQYRTGEGLVLWRGNFRGIVADYSIARANFPISKKWPFRGSTFQQLTCFQPYTDGLYLPLIPMIHHLGGRRALCSANKFVSGDGFGNRGWLEESLESEEWPFQKSPGQGRQCVGCCDRQRER